MTRRPRVYVPSDSGNDLSAAEEYGDLIHITQGFVDKKNELNTLASRCEQIMADVTEEDYILITGLSSLVALAACVMTAKVGLVNFLIFNRGRYVRKTVVFPG